MRLMDRHILERIFEYNINFQRENGVPPTFRRIMQDLKLGSLATVRRYVLELERENRIHRTSKGTIAPLPQLTRPHNVIVPLIGDVACGQPNYGEEQYEDCYALPRTLFGAGELFMLHAVGESMIGIGIHDGDLIVIRRQNSAKNGDIVIALVDGKTTLKRFNRNTQHIILHPENTSMQDIIVTNCEIQGILVGCIKLY